MTLSPAQRWIPTARDNTLYLVSIIWPDHVLICLPCGGRPVRAGETRAIQTVVCAGKSLGVLAPRLRGPRAWGIRAARPLSRLFVSVKATRALLDSIVGHYLSWKLLVCAPEPWVLIVFILSTPLPFHASAFPPFPPCSSAHTFPVSFCLVSPNSTIPSPQAVTPSTCPFLLPLYQHRTPSILFDCCVASCKQL